MHAAVGAWPRITGAFAPKLGPAPVGKENPPHPPSRKSIDFTRVVFLHVFVFILMDVICKGFYLQSIE